MGAGHTDGFVEVAVPHVVDGAARAAHDKRPEAEEASVDKWHRWRRVERVGRHRDGPCCSKSGVQQSSAGRVGQKRQTTGVEEE